MMSIQLINQYYNNLDRIQRFSGARNESAVRQAFYTLLNEYAHKKNLELVTEIPCRGTKGVPVRPDGILKNALRLDYGYWESKDEADDINEEIQKKIKKGYPLSNILFEDSSTAVLYQNGNEVMRVNVKNEKDLDKILTAFISFEQPEVKEFSKALDQFKQDVPDIVKTLRDKIEEASKGNAKFQKARDAFIALCQEEINPDITPADIREMIIQHILTADIFNVVFDEPHFHRENNIAKELERVIDTFFTGSSRKNALESIQHYYRAINAAAAGIADHHEKQKFLKIIYENFYKVYNPKAADKLGVIYTPNEIVHFMIASIDYLLRKHFGRGLADKNVEILDPTTGTGTFICDLIEYIPSHKLDYKYQEEIHANEVAILPYYIANLNIEFTFKQKMGHYREFGNICFVDTLDNTAGLVHEFRQEHMFGVSSENTARIKRQNTRKISVVMGNPPYNANQKNENENNKNREYPMIDRRIKETYIKYSTAQKTKLYDMYARFYRWASDRVDENGIVAFITNRSFIDSRTFDGFRKCISDEFSHCYIVDTRSDVRINPKIAGTTHNVFGIQTGVAVMFLVKKKEKNQACRIEYFTLQDEQKKQEKLEWFRSTKIQDIPFEEIHPDAKNNWLNIADTDFESLSPLIDKEAKAGKHYEVIYQIYSTGISTNRDEWIIDFSKNNLKNKMTFFSNFFNNYIHSSTEYDNTIKWSRNLKQRHLRQNKELFSPKRIIKFTYRPYVPVYLYNSDIFIDEHGRTNQMFSNDNLAICISGNGSSKPFHVLAVDTYASLDLLEKTQILPLYIYDKESNCNDNITDWILNKFRTWYTDEEITKKDIFYYTYAVLHNPDYRTKYELDLKREFPHLPFYDDFRIWRDWGKALLHMHIKYEEAKPYQLTRTDKELNPPKEQKEMFETTQRSDEKLIKDEPKLKVKLKADKTAGTIEIDEQTILSGVPAEAWEYRLGNRSALEWVLDQYKERKPSDPTIAEKFNTYRFADYKEQVIELLKRVCTVSVDTMKIIAKMPRFNSHQDT